MLQTQHSGVFINGFGRFPGYRDGRRHRLAGIEIGGGSAEAYNARLQRVCPDARPVGADQLASMGRRLIQAAASGRPASFVPERMAEVPVLTRMRIDRGWRLHDGMVERLDALLDYVDEPEDLIPDAVPVIGQLDDALLVDLFTRDIAGELADYRDFCGWREGIAARCGVPVALVEVDAEAWLHERVRERSLGSLGLRGHYARSSGLAAFRVA